MRSTIQLIILLVLIMRGAAAFAADARVARGEYLVRFGGCNDCHTPGYFLGKPDPSRFLGGSDVGFDLPGAGTFVGVLAKCHALDQPACSHDRAHSEKRITSGQAVIERRRS